MENDTKIERLIKNRLFKDNDMYKHMGNIKPDTNTPRPSSPPGASRPVESNLKQYEVIIWTACTQHTEVLHIEAESLENIYEKLCCHIEIAYEYDSPEFKKLEDINLKDVNAKENMDRIRKYYGESRWRG